MGAEGAIAIACGRAGESTRWTVASPARKLAWRARLPGASGYDKAAHVLRVLQAEGATGVSLLPLALPVSWMVNSQATSRAFQKWLAPPSTLAWAALLEAVGFALSPEGWLDLAPEARAVAAAAVESLAAVGDGASVTSVSKVLALLRPQVVPLMDDAAITFALGAPASVASFVPMMDWFARAVVVEEAPLIAVAVAHEAAVLDAAQVLDRLLWFDSTGFKAAPGFARISEPGHESVVDVPGP